MNFVYHLVPKDMRGNILYPLNELKTIFPKLYNKKAEKYKGREFLMKETIPVLNCLWNDVLHFSVVNPCDIKKALVESGYSFEAKFYKIDAMLLNKEKTVIYLFNDKDINTKLKISDFERYNLKNVSKYYCFPEGVKEYYKREFKKGRWPLLFYGIPHILFKGSINIENVPIVSV